MLSNVVFANESSTNTIYVGLNCATPLSIIHLSPLYELSVNTSDKNNKIMCMCLINFFLSFILLFLLTESVEENKTCGTDVQGRDVDKSSCEGHSSVRCVRANITILSYSSSSSLF